MIKGSPGSRRWRSNPCPTRKGGEGGGREDWAADFTESCCSTWIAAKTAVSGRGRCRNDWGKAERGVAEGTAGGRLRGDLAAIEEAKETEDEAMAEEKQNKPQS